MVVLEEGGMLTTGHNQYLQPDYLSPLPTVSNTSAQFTFRFRSILQLLAYESENFTSESEIKPLKLNAVNVKLAEIVGFLYLLSSSFLIGSLFLDPTELERHEKQSARTFASLSYYSR